jgi:hypothetical protein
MINAMSAAVSAGEWHDMMPEYVGVMVVAAVATIAKYALRIRRQLLPQGRGSAANWKVHTDPQTML